MNKIDKSRDAVRLHPSWAISKFAANWISSGLPVFATWETSEQARSRRQCVWDAAEELAKAKSPGALIEVSSEWRARLELMGELGQEVAENLHRLETQGQSWIAQGVKKSGPPNFWLSKLEVRARRAIAERGWGRLESRIRAGAQTICDEFGFADVEFRGLSAKKCLAAIRLARGSCQIARERLGLENPLSLGGGGRARLRLESSAAARQTRTLGLFQTKSLEGAPLGRISLDIERREAGWTLAHEWIHLMDWGLGKLALLAGGEQAGDASPMFTSLPLEKRMRLREAQEGFSLAFGALQGMADEKAEMRLQLLGIRRERELGRRALEMAAGEAAKSLGSAARSRAEKALAAWAKASANERWLGNELFDAKKEKAEALDVLRVALKAADFGEKELDRAREACELAGLHWGPTGLAMGEGLFAEESLRGSWASKTGYWASPAEMIARAAGGIERDRPWRHALRAGLGAEIFRRLRLERIRAPLLEKSQAEAFSRGISIMSEVAGLGKVRLKTSWQEDRAARVMVWGAKQAARVRAAGKRTYAKFKA